MDKPMSLSQKAIFARRRQQRLPYSDTPAVPHPPVRTVSSAERDEAYAALDDALRAVNGFRVIRHPQRHHLIDGLLLGLDGGLRDVQRMADKLKASPYLRGKKWVTPNKLLTDVTFQTNILANVYDDGGNQ
jgi:hypothetical protein